MQFLVNQAIYLIPGHSSVFDISFFVHHRQLLCFLFSPVLKLGYPQYPHWLFWANDALTDWIWTPYMHSSPRSLWLSRIIVDMSFRISSWDSLEAYSDAFPFYKLETIQALLGGWQLEYWVVFSLLHYLLLSKVWKYIFFPSSFCGTEDRSQVLTHAGYEVYHRATSPA